MELLQDVDKDALRIQGLQWIVSLDGPWRATSPNYMDC